MTVLGGLNPAQRRAAGHGAEGPARPLVVLAGPGTGKTRVIVRRIAHLVRERDVPPERILAVTFTVKAAGEMRTRLAEPELIGPAADRVQVFTFHGLGWRLLQRFGDSIGLPPTPALMDTAQTRRLLRELIRRHGLFAQTRALGPDVMLDACIGTLGALQDRGIEPEAAVRCATEWGERLARGEIRPAAAPQHAEGSTGDGSGPVPGDGNAKAKTRRVRASQAAPDVEMLLAAEREAHGRFADMAALAEHFDTACRARGWVNYGDLICLAIRLLRTRPGVAAIIQSELPHVIVDEFQDVNPAQIELLRLLAPPALLERAADGARSLVVVGDDDQAIYAFRGADERAFATFASGWPTYEQVALTENYRSVPEVIRVGNDIISRATWRFDPEKVIEACAAGKLRRGSVEAVKLTDDREDASVIAAMLLTDRARRAAAGQPCDWSSYAVIARSHNDLERVAAALELEGVPVRRSREAQLGLDAGVLDVNAWLELLTDPRCASAALRILVRPPYHVATDRAADWLYAWRQAAALARAGGSDNDPGPILAWLAARYADDSEHGPALQRAAALESELAALAATLPACEVIHAVITRADLAHAELLPGPERARRIAALVCLMRFARTRQARLEAPGDVAAWLAYLNDLSEDERLRMESGEGSIDTLLSDSGTADGDSVRLVTAHGAKGLEFRTVLVPRVSPTFGYGQRRADEPVLPPELLGPGRGDRSLTLGDEERRLFYVACTRAQDRLVLLAKWNKNPSSSVHFFEELARTPKELLVSVSDGAAELAAAAAAGVKLNAAGPSDLELQGNNTARARMARERGRLRQQAAQALDAADRPGATADDLAQARARLAEVAERLGVLAAVEAGLALPAWSEQSPSARDQAERTARLLSAGAGGLTLRGFTPPLRLSYSAIDQYHRCPRCYYAKFALHLPEPARAETTLGTVAHAALQRFYRRWRDADAEGVTPPGVEDLVKLGREAYLQAIGGPSAVSGQRRIADAGEMQRLDDLLRGTFATFHDPRAHVLELEWDLRVPYVREGQRHVLEARVDRVDRRPDGGLHVIDYKSGKAWKRLLEPEADDLQMGVYALALGWQESRDQAGSGGLQGAEACNPPAGVAEYWLIAEGKRGRIDLAALKLEKVRARIDAAIDGILAGEFMRGKECTGLCAILGS